MVGPAVDLGLFNLPTAGKHTEFNLKVVINRLTFQNDLYSCRKNSSKPGMPVRGRSDAAEKQRGGGG